LTAALRQHLAAPGESGLMDIACSDIRPFSDKKHQKPTITLSAARRYVMMAQPIHDAMGSNAAAL
jgi:tRNA G37 N-methylase TrmD